ncbi:MAG: hypothetical protein GY796_21840, partial [Chloroflexi bacterium]|nr:hypothetical protein [Chloroflexota bacterium]
QAYRLTAQMQGSDGRLFLAFDNGNVLTLQDGATNLTDFTIPAAASSFQVGTEAVLDTGVHTFTQLDLTAFSDAQSVQANRSYDLALDFQGEVNVPAGETGIEVALYDSNYNQLHSLWSVEDFSDPSGWTTAAVTFPSLNSDIHMGISTRLDSGWLTFADPTLTEWSEPINLNGTLPNLMDIEVTGQLNAAVGDGGKLLLAEDGSVVELWPNPANFNGSASIQHGPFTANSVQIGLETHLHTGNLAVDEMGLTFLSALQPAAANRDYDITVNLQGAINAPSGETGVELALYDTAGNQLQSLWSTEDFNNSSGWTTINGSFTPTSNGDIRLG